MVNIFAREITDDLASLVKQIDETVAKNEDKRMKAFVVLLTEDADADAAKLKKLAEAKDIKHTPLTIFDGASGPNRYNIAKDADVTVIMWVKGRVEANHALAKGKLDAEATKKIVADTEKILK